MPTFSHKFKFLGAIGWCIVANMVSEVEVLGSNPSGRDLSK
jgi:hypothetical protein